MRLFEMRNPDFILKEILEIMRFFRFNSKAVLNAEIDSETLIRLY